MPELPEVETTVRGLAPALLGHVLAHVDVRRPDLRRAIPVDLRQRMTGARITGLQRRAKYGIVETDRGDSMIFHLGMSGRWRVDAGAIGMHDHLVLTTDLGRVLALCDPRRFGSIDLVETRTRDAWPPFAALGPEPLGNAFDANYLKQALKGRVATIKALLLDQRIVAGLGNIYVCEALNMAGIAPALAAGKVSRSRLERLVTAIRAVLSSAIEAGGSSLRDYVRPDGQLGYFAKQWRVYGLEGGTCPCGGTVARRAESGRSTFWCPACQR